MSFGHTGNTSFFSSTGGTARKPTSTGVSFGNLAPPTPQVFGGAPSSNTSFFNPQQTPARRSLNPTSPGGGSYAPMSVSQTGRKPPTPASPTTSERPRVRGAGIGLFAGNAGATGGFQGFGAAANDRTMNPGQMSPTQQRSTPYPTGGRARDMRTRGAQGGGAVREPPKQSMYDQAAMDLLPGFNRAPTSAMPLLPDQAEEDEEARRTVTVVGFNPATQIQAVMERFQQFGPIEKCDKHPIIGNSCIIIFKKEFDAKSACSESQVLLDIRTPDSRGEGGLNDIFSAPPTKYCVIVVPKINGVDSKIHGNGIQVPPRRPMYGRVKGERQRGAEWHNPLPLPVPAGATAPTPEGGWNAGSLLTNLANFFIPF
eukprot:comp17316_c0_seq1/m.16497 comp17316_c0_seq1/g.16497  ORF comp17316_c0_seq1/g.16497 comp17316_c0_seq1/m.16497 type:complete len:370 (-) comp17316_c0_seq1:278-1387(-)